MAGPTSVPFEGVFVLSYFSGNGHSSVRIVHLTGEHFGIIKNKCPCGDFVVVIGVIFKILSFGAFYSYSMLTLGFVNIQTEQFHQQILHQSNNITNTRN